MKKLGIFVFVIICLSIQSCGKEGDYIPDIPFNLNISTIELDNINDSPGKVVILSRKGAGVAGLVFYNNGSRILAYDRCSSVNPEQRNPVTWIEGTNLVEDKVSGALFILTDGSAYKAPASRSLKAYHVSLNGNYITVSN